MVEAQLCSKIVITRVRVAHLRFRAWQERQLNPLWALAPWTLLTGDSGGLAAERRLR